jgi:peptidoglycan/xylan/chitin deacetylase (PgdA/CDA1 family)
MIFHRIKRKIYKAFHPVVGEIWMLHRVVEQRSDKPEQRELEVTVDWLEQKILEYKQKGYTFVSLDKLSSILNSHRCVCLTFDDGYRDNYTLAYPLLKRLGVPFAVYITTGFIDNRLPMWWYEGEQLGLSTEELKALDADDPLCTIGAHTVSHPKKALDADDPLCTIGAHTVSHPKLDTLTREQQYQEIYTSIQTLEAILGHEIKHFSFPHGAHNADTLAICRELGFQTVVQSWGGPLRRGENPYPLPRINVKQP